MVVAVWEQGSLVAHATSKQNGIVGVIDARCDAVSVPIGMIKGAVERDGAVAITIVVVPVFKTCLLK